MSDNATSIPTPSRAPARPDPSMLPDWALVDVSIPCTVLGSSRSHFLALVKAGEAPQPVVTGNRFTRWRMGDVREFAERIAASGSKSNRSGA